MNDTFYLCSLIAFQLLVRLRLGALLEYDSDYSVYSLFTVVKENGGRPGKDFEICWGNKYLAHLLNHFAQVIYPSIHSPRLLGHALFCLTSVLIYYCVLHYGGDHHAGLLGAGFFALASSHPHSVSYNTNIETILLPVQCGVLLLMNFKYGWLFQGILLGVVTGWGKFIYAAYAIVPFCFYFSIGSYAWHFILSFVLTVLSTVVLHTIQRFTPIHQSMREVAIYSNSANTLFTWGNFLLWGKTLFWGFGCRTLFLWVGLGYVLIQLLLGYPVELTSFSLVIVGGGLILLQRKFGPLHFLSLYSPLSILISLELPEASCFTRVLFLLVGMSCAFLLHTLFLDRDSLGKLFWQQVRMRNWLAEQGSKAAAEFLQKTEPDLAVLFCPGIISQPYLWLRIHPPSPMPYYDCNSLFLPRVIHDLEAWARTHKPERILFNDVDSIEYIPIELLSGLFGCSYTYERSFSGGEVILFKQSGVAKPSYKAIYQAIKFLPILRRSVSAEAMGATLSESTVKELAQAGTGPLIIYDQTPETQRILEAAKEGKRDVFILERDIVYQYLLNLDRAGTVLITGARNLDVAIFMEFSESLTVLDIPEELGLSFLPGKEKTWESFACSSLGWQYSKENGGTMSSPGENRGPAAQFVCAMLRVEREKKKA